MSKKIYKLRDIEKALTYTPPLFILILAMFSMVVSYFVMEYRENSKIELLTQKQKFLSQTSLTNYISAVNLQIKEHLGDIEKELKKSVYTLKGIHTGAATKITKLLPFIEQIQKENNINFVIFDKNLNVFHGLKIAKNIQHLIFNQKEDKKLLDITLLYILSQGKSSSLSWKNDLNRTIQLSYFEKSEDGELFIGAFSLVDDLKSLTTKSFLNSIRKDLYLLGNSYFWLYNNAEKKIFNLKNQKKWKILSNIDEQQTFIHLNKYFLTIGINQSWQSLISAKNIIQTEYSNKKTLNFMIIIFTSFILISFTTIFSAFIKKIFSTYDLELKDLVKKEVAKNQKKQKLLIQQNKLAAMGEMIESIAHQWRQPLNNISLIIHFIRDNVKNKSFIDTMLNDYVERAKKQITYMSDTIDDFKDFYKPSKSKELFDTKEAIKSTLFIMQTELDKNDIKVNINGKPLHVNGYENEFKQAILNILANAKDAINLKRRNDSNFKGQITISIDKEISIYNNGGKAQQEVLERMFEPYFTTKFEDKGTGIGLYMTKTIIENSMNGKIYAKNKDAGVVFGIIFSEGIQNG